MAKTKERKGQIVPRVTRDLSPFEEMDHLFNQMWEGGFFSPFQSHWPNWAPFRAFEDRLPHVDVIDRENEVLVRAEIPGLDKEHLDVSLSDEYLTIKGEEHEEKREEGEYYRSEIRHGSFTRTVHLPAQVDGEKAKAEFQDGILKISIPKMEQSKRHSVEIK